MILYYFFFNNDEEVTPHMKSELLKNISTFHSKRYLILCIEFLMERGYVFSHLYEMNNLNISFPEACRMNVITKKSKSMI